MIIFHSGNAGRANFRAQEFLIVAVGGSRCISFWITKDNKQHDETFAIWKNMNLFFAGRTGKTRLLTEALGASVNSGRLFSFHYLREPDDSEQFKLHKNMDIYFASNHSKEARMTLIAMMASRLFSFYGYADEIRKHSEEFMRIYLAGEGHAVMPQVRQFMADNGVWRLLSAYSERKAIKPWVALIKERPARLFLDSGAFSAFTKGVEIDLNEYCDFIKENLEYLYLYANLDVIGDAEKTYGNQKRMEERGLNPLPIFHHGEDFEWLDRYCNEYDYVGLGGMVPVPKAHLPEWLDNVFHRYPDHKFHGFGMTSPILIKHYPWESVDSTTWVMTSAFGGIVTPYGQFSVSSQQLKDKNHLAHATEPDRKAVLDWLGKYGITEEDLDDYKVRDIVNIVFYLELERDWEPPDLSGRFITMELF